MTKKILIITEFFYPEEFKINDIALEWKKRGYDVDVITQVPTYPFGVVFGGYKNKWVRKDDYNGINIYRVKAITGYKKSLLKKLLKYITFMILGNILGVFVGKKYDYILGYNMGALTSMMPAVLIKKIYKKPLVFWVQDLWPDSVYAYGFKRNFLLEKFLNFLVGFMYGNIDGLAVSSYGFIDKLKPYIKKKIEMKYLPNWSDDLDDKLEAYSFSNTKKVHFTFAGNVGKVQNLENVIEAFANLNEKYSKKAQLNIIGDGSNLENLKKIVQKNNYRNIIFYGRKPRNKMSSYYKGSDFLIVSLTNKPIFELTVPAKTQTYISTKKPIFAIINGETSRLVIEKKLGLVARPDDIREIILGFEKCIDMNIKEKHKFAQNSENLTNTIFNKEKTIASLLKLLIRIKK